MSQPNNPQPEQGQVRSPQPKQLQSQHTNLNQANPPTLSIPTLQDSRNKAKVAILALRDIGVRYQDFIDEGFDLTIIRGLFKELGLDVRLAAEPGNQDSGSSSSLCIPSSIPSPHSPSSRAPRPTAETRSSAKATTRAVSERTRKPALPALSVDDKTKSRMDEIASLLGQKKGNKAPTTGNQTSPPAKIPAPEMPAPESANPSAESKALSEKEYHRQKKMDALEKSRAARKQRDEERKMSTTSQPQSRSRQEQVDRTPICNISDTLNAAAMDELVQLNVYPEIGRHVTAADIPWSTTKDSKNKPRIPQEKKSRQPAKTPAPEMTVPEMPVLESIQTSAESNPRPEKEFHRQKKMDALEKSRAARQQRDEERRMATAQ